MQPVPGKFVLQRTADPKVRHIYFDSNQYCVRISGKASTAKARHQRTESDQPLPGCNILAGQYIDFYLSINKKQFICVKVLVFLYFAAYWPLASCLCVIAWRRAARLLLLLKGDVCGDIPVVIAASCHDHDLQCGMRGNSRGMQGNSI